MKPTPTIFAVVMPNIKFTYMYRDGANYKNHEGVIFPNPENTNIEEAEKIIQSKLITETWFYVDQWALKDLHFETGDNEIDHLWHEFVSLEYTDELATGSKTFGQFLNEIPFQE